MKLYSLMMLEDILKLIQCLNSIQTLHRFPFIIIYFQLYCYFKIQLETNKLLAKARYSQSISFSKNIYIIQTPQLNTAYESYHKLNKLTRRLIFIKCIWNKRKGNFNLIIILRWVLDKYFP